MENGKDYEEYDDEDDKPGIMALPSECPMCASPPNRPVPWAQSPAAMSEGYAMQVRSYNEVPEVEPLKISGRTR